MSEYKYVEYPKYKYHPSKDPVVVENKSAESALGEDYVDSPAEYGVISAPSVDQALAIEAKKLADLEAKKSQKAK